MKALQQIFSVQHYLVWEDLKPHARMPLLRSIQDRLYRSLGDLRVTHNQARYIAERTIILEGEN